MSSLPEVDLAVLVHRARDDRRARAPERLVDAFTRVRGRDVVYCLLGAFARHASRPDAMVGGSVQRTTVVGTLTIFLVGVVGSRLRSS